MAIPRSAPLVSGGSVLDQASNVIGGSISELDALKLAERVPDLPQNINFAIRGEFVRDFLQANRIELTVSADSTNLESTEIASRSAAVNRASAVLSGRCACWSSRKRAAVTR